MSAYEQIRNRLSSNGKVTEAVIPHSVNCNESRWSMKDIIRMCDRYVLDIWKYLSGQEWVYTVEKGGGRYECRR